MQPKFLNLNNLILACTSSGFSIAICGHLTCQSKGHGDLDLDLGLTIKQLRFPVYAQLKYSSHVTGNVMF